MDMEHAGHIMSSNYMEHGYCLNWEKPLLILHVGSDIITGIAYYSIPMAMLYFAYRRRDIPFLRIFILFAVFILACGTTHFFSAYTIFRPQYWAEGYIKAFTAIVSALTAVIFIPRIPEAIAFPSIMITLDEIKKLNSELGIMNSELQMANFSIENVNDAVYWIKSDGQISRVNKAACTMLGYTFEEMQRYRIFELDPLFHEERWERHWIELKTKGVMTFETQHRAKNGGILDVEVTANYLTYAGDEFNCSTVRDITMRKRSELELLESRKLYCNLVEGTPDLITRVDTEGHILFVNHAALKIYGLHPEDCIGRLAFDFIHPDDLAATMTAFHGWLKSDQEIFTFENRQIRVDGKGHHHMVWSIRAEHDEYGNVSGFASSARDITDQKHAEDVNTDLENQLQQAQKMESVGRLAGGVAHDFNNMLTVILGHAELGLLRLEPNHRACADLKEICKTAQRSADLTRQLLAFARKQTIAPKVIDLNDTVTEMLKMLQRIIGEDINLVWQPASKLWQIRMDPSQIDQILANLCVNARDAIDGNGRITIETANAIIDTDYCTSNHEATPGEYVRLTVSDTGSGMDKETQSHIFEPFYTTKELGKGTGLGLATVYGAVKQNSGFINIYSEKGKGTTFSIYLPRNESIFSSLAREDNNTAIPVSRGHETILLVEDDSDILNIACSMLENQGYTVLNANTPGEAVRLAREHTGEIQLLMTDVIMPEMNGRDLAKKLLLNYPLMKQLYMSGYTADVIASHGVLEEGVNFIQKPFTLYDMAAKVRDVLDSKTIN